jgi:hypothetical protein
MHIQLPRPELRRDPDLDSCQIADARFELSLAGKVHWAVGNG